MKKKDLPLVIPPKIKLALSRGDPIVALESSLIAQGLPKPENLNTAYKIEAAVIQGGALPATIAINQGQVHIGCNEDMVKMIAQKENVVKVSRRDIAAVLASGKCGATTVAATIACATEAGIDIMATGGIGGVHLNSTEHFDISADLNELQRSPVAVVCSGAKAILDIPKTLEVLESASVPVIGYNTNFFPAFFSTNSEFTVPYRVNTPDEAATLINIQSLLGGGLVIANPPPASSALDLNSVNKWIAQALDESRKANIIGKDLTPFLLSRLIELSDGKTLKTNQDLIVQNATLAAHIAVSLSKIT